MKTREVDQKLRKKLGLVPIDCKRHTQYVVMGNAKSILPTIVALSRGSSEISLTNEKGLAQAIGLRLDHWREMIRCNISSECVTFVFVTKILAFAAERLEILGLSYLPVAVSVADTCKFICNRVKLTQAKFSEKESALVQESLVTLGIIGKHAALRSVVRLMESAVARDCVLAQRN